MKYKLKPKFKLTKRNFILAAVVVGLLGGPSYAAFKKHVEPLLVQPTQLLFSRLPVVYRNLTPIPVRYRTIRNIPVTVIPKGAGGIRVTFKNLSTIKIYHKGGKRGDAFPELPGLNQVRVRQTRSRGVRPPTDEEE